MCTDTSLAAIEIVRLYGLRFKVEHTFKQAVRLIGSSATTSGCRHEAAAPPQRQACRRGAWWLGHASGKPVEQALPVSIGLIACTVKAPCLGRRPG